MWGKPEGNCYHVGWGRATVIGQKRQDCVTYLPWFWLVKCSGEVNPVTGIISPWPNPHLTPTCQFARKPFDVVCLQCEHSHWPQCPFLCNSRLPAQCGWGLMNPVNRLQMVKILLCCRAHRAQRCSQLCALVTCLAISLVCLATFRKNPRRIANFAGF